jgi:hypothetical protein
MARWDLPCKELLTHFKVAYTHQLPWIACALSPDISVDVLCHPDYQSKRLLVWFRKAKEATLLQYVQSVVHSYP